MNPYTFAQPYSSSLTQQHLQSLNDRANNVPFASQNSGLIRTVILLAVILAAPGFAEDSLPPAKNVLLLHSYHRGLMWTRNVSRGLEQVLDNDTTLDVVLHTEYLDAKSPHPAGYLQAMADLLELKYRDTAFDLVVCSDDPALDFILQHKRVLFPTTPVVFCGVNYFDRAALKEHEDITGVVEAIDIARTLYLALRQHPRTERIVIINDRTRTGQANKRLFREKVSPYLNTDVPITFWESMPMEQLLARTATLEEGTIVLLLSFTQGSNGQVFSYRQSIKLISAHCHVPIYGVWEFYLGNGIVGGRLTSGQAQGRAAAAMAVSVLQGTPVQDLPIVEQSPNVYKFDYVQLQRFGIKEEKLPRGRAIVNRPPQFLKIPKRTYGATVALTVLLGLTVLVLGVVICLLKRAETARQRLEKHMQQTQKLESLGVMAGGIAHDFNNLLMGILGNASLASMEVAPDSDIGKNVHEIQKAATRAAKLTTQLLAYSGRGKLLTQQVDIAKLTKEMQPLMERAVTKRAHVSWKIGDVPPVDADVAQLRQVILNLVINASEAIDATTVEQGEIIIRLASEYIDQKTLQRAFYGETLLPGTYVIIEVDDNGCGIDKQLLQKVFDPFYTTKFPGRGLGLAAVAGIVRGHGGALQVNSKKGIGTQMRVLFPAAHIDRSPAMEAENETGVTARVKSSSKTTRQTVLVVDDEQGVRDVCRSILQREGYHVLTASDGAEGLEVVEREKNKIDAVLLDLTMPKKDGVETLREIRKISTSIPVIISSGYTEHDTGKRFAAGDYQGFIHKPYAPSKLIGQLKAVMAAPAPLNPNLSP